MTPPKHAQAICAAIASITIVTLMIATIATIAVTRVSALPRHDAGAVARDDGLAALSANADDRGQDGRQQGSPPAGIAVSQSGMTVVIIKGKRLTAPERRRATLANLAAPEHS